MTKQPESAEESVAAWIAAMSASELVLEIENTVIELTAGASNPGPLLDRLRLLRREILRRMSR